MTQLKKLKQYFLFPQSVLDAELAKILWIIRLRWLAILFFTLLLGPGLLLGYITSTQVPPFLGTLSLLLILIACALLVL